MNNELYWIYLQKSVGYHAHINNLLTFFGSAEKIYRADENALRTCGLFGNGDYEIKPQKIRELKRTSLEDCEKIFSECQKEGISVITPESDFYPDSLRLLSDMPAVLYAKGDLSVLREDVSVAVMGSRNPTPYGIEAAGDFVKGFCENGIVTVSGGADGIDTFSHRCALDNGGKTVMVLGSGHLSDYALQSKVLIDSVCKNGAVISEYPPYTKASIFSFPKRNRIISGISKGVLIIEAGSKSGTLNLAQHATRQGKEIFVLPGDNKSECYIGSHKLISEGAYAVFCPEDILKFYFDYIEFQKETGKETSTGSFSEIGQYSPSKRAKTTGLKKKNSAELKQPVSNENKKSEKITEETVSSNAFLVYNLMSVNKMTLDEITRESALPVRKVLSALTELEMLGAVCLTEGNMYSLK